MLTVKLHVLIVSRILLPSVISSMPPHLTHTLTHTLPLSLSQWHLRKYKCTFIPFVPPNGTATHSREEKKKKI